MGETLEALLNEEKRGYAPLKPLVSLYTDTDDGRDPDTFDVAVDKMRKATEELIERIEQEAQTPIERFTIGKSFARGMKNRHFDSNNFKTWRKEGIKSRWGTKYEKEGYNGLVVLVGITQELLPSVLKKGSYGHLLPDQQQYALALEQQLIHYFLFVAKDPRLGNTSLSPGKQEQNPYAGVLYLAFKLSSIGEIWQQFEDAFELEREPNDTIFIITRKKSSIKVPGADGNKKVIGGRKAEERVLTFLEGKSVKKLKLKLFVNNVPSEQFARALLEVRPPNKTAVIIARNIESSTETLQLLSNNGCIARDFVEDDWRELGEILYQPVDGITPWKAVENEKFKTYLEKSNEAVLEIFEDSMLEEDEKQWIASESNDQVFIISYTGGKKIIGGKIVENRTIHFLKDQKGNLGLIIKIYINYLPKEKFIKRLSKTVREDGKLTLASILIGSNGETNEKPIETKALTVELRTITAQDWEELEQLLDDKTTDRNQVSAEDSEEPIASSSKDDPHLDTVQTMASDMSNLTLESQSAVETEEANLDD